MFQRVDRVKAVAVVSGVLGVLLLAALLRADDPPASKISEERVLMRAKLTSSQKVLEGLLSEDFGLIQQGAKEMKRISEAAEWPRHRDTVYEHYAAEFRRQCSQLQHLASQGNHEGASFTYLHMTTTCIGCHNYVRESLRIARQPEGGVQLIPTQIPE